jgi:hypothetical protein
MCPGTTAYRRHTLKDQTDREEHCSTLVDLRLHSLPKYHSPFGIVFVFVFVLCPSPGSVHVPLGGIRHPNSRCVRRCGVVCDDVMCRDPSCSVPGGCEGCQGGDLRAVE